MTSKSDRETRIPGPNSLKLAGDLRQFESPNVTYIAEDFPVFWRSAQGSTVTDVDGNDFLDFTSAFGVASIGHTHPAVVKAIKSQAEHLIHGMGDVHPTAVKVDLCRRIAELVPIQDARIILSQNGGDAIESALKTAAIATGRSRVLAFKGAYHGLSYGALETTHRLDFKAPFRNQLGGFANHVPYGCALESIEAELRSREYSAVLAEPIQGRGGIIVPPSGWLKGVHALCREYCTLLVLDEIFTGWSRTGDLFACLYEDVVPDILCIGKAMGGGLPISACVASKSIMDTWGESTGEALHTSTFLGNPLACAAALAAIGVIIEDNLAVSAVKKGEYLRGKLDVLLETFPNDVLEIRGRGLMIGLQLSSKALALSLVTCVLSKGLIVLPAGDGSVIELIPPLVVSEGEMDRAVSIFTDALSERARSKTTPNPSTS